MKDTRQEMRTQYLAPQYYSDVFIFTTKNEHTFLELVLRDSQRSTEMETIL